MANTKQIGANIKNTYNGAKGSQDDKSGRE